MKIFAFAASNNIPSINKQLITYAATHFPNDAVEVLDLTDYELPLYSTPREQSEGVPLKAQAFSDKIRDADAIIAAFPEHNGGFTAVYKNLHDWVSRLEGSVYQNKPIVILSTSKGPRGGATVLNHATTIGPFQGMDIKGQMALPRFHETFDAEKGEIIDPALKDEFAAVMQTLKAA